jgi:hypothetical protein
MFEIHPASTLLDYAETGLNPPLARGIFFNHILMTIDFENVKI